MRRLTWFFLLLVVVLEGAQPPADLPKGRFDPAFSPDGSRLAFAWSGVKNDNYDIYVGENGDAQPRRITSHPAAEYSPAWSPDGRQIAFCRQSSDGNEILLTPAEGGSERRLGVSSADRCLIDWSPDGRFLAVVHRARSGEPESIFALMVADGEMKRLTSPPSQALGDGLPAFRPDGGALAFSRVFSESGADILVLPLAEQAQERVEPRAVTSGERAIRGLDWTPDGRAILFTSNRAGLWKVAAGGGTPELLPEGGSNVHTLSASPKGQVAYAQYVNNTNIWRTDGPATAGLRSRRAPVATRIVASDVNDASPHVSRDGRKIVFSSTRSGTWEVWTCDSDGSHLRQVTFFGDTPVGSTRWSPDGRRIAFDGQKPGHYDLYVVDEDGGDLRQLTSETSTDVKPSWSRDGRWIYYTSNRTGDYQVWKIPADGGEPVQITRNGGYTPFESYNGKFVYYAKGLDDHTLWRIPVGGGEETRVLDGVVSNRWILTEQGVCILNMEAKPRPEIEFFDFAGRQRRSLNVLPEQAVIYGGGTALAAPPDGQWLLYCQLDGVASKIKFLSLKF